jgi:hypothetical protein
MLLPLIFIILATVASAFVAYGTSASWGRYAHGLDLIVWTRTFQWPLVAFAIVMCVGLLAMIVSGKRRAWWLIGLAPVMALFAHRFHTRPGEDLGVLENPPMQTAFQAAAAVSDDTWVVGIILDDQVYALPYNQLWYRPVVLIQQREKKWIVIWNAYANRAVAMAVDRDVRARDLEVVSTPANSVLIYNSRLGEFIVGVTGQTTDGQTPGGFRSVVPFSKTTFGQWRTAYPESQVLAAVVPAANAPKVPILPRDPTQGAAMGVDPLTRIAIVSTKTPAAFNAAAVGETPVNTMFGNDPVLLIRDGFAGSVRAFDRRIDEDLFIKLKPYRNPRKPRAHFADDSSGSLWNRSMLAIEGGPEIRDKKLTRLLVEEDLYWGVMKYWMKDLQLYQPQ